MYKTMLIAFMLVFSAGSFLWAAPAQAQATRTWVSGVGDDANPCSRTAPCKTFAGAIPKTAAKGEINCIDPGSFGAVTITKSISIICDDTLAGVLASFTNAVIVNVGAADKVTLSGLSIEGAGTGLHGIRMVGAGALDVLNTHITGFTNNAITVAGSSGASVFVQDSVLSNSLGGVEVDGAAGVSNSVIISRVTILRTTNFGVKVGATSIAVLNEFTLAGSTASISTVAGAIVQSYGNNIIRNAGLPTTTLPLR